MTTFEILALVFLAICMGLLITLLILLPTRKKIGEDTRYELSRTEANLARAVSDSENDVCRSLQDTKYDIKQSVNDSVGKFGEIKTDILRDQAAQQERITNALTKQTESVTKSLEDRMGRLQESNEKKLDEMRGVVDEKLTKTLNDRLAQSFTQVQEQLENVYKSLGEMKTLAGDVNSLQMVLSNVKARGTFAEIQLGNLLEQTLTQEQYIANFSLGNKSADNRVEFAIKLPSRVEEGEFVYLPIDSKFPQEDYLRIVEAADAADKPALDAATKSLENFIKDQAKKIHDLYIEPPKTTDFAIMFLPTEGLYAEVLRRPGLAEEVQRKHHIMICGPTTITAFLNTISVGFRTLAIDKHTAEVWRLLEATKGQYETFGEALSKAAKNIATAGGAVEAAVKRNDIIRKKLKSVEELAGAESDTLFGVDKLLLEDE